MLSKLLANVRYAIVLIPLFGLGSSLQLGCEIKQSDDIAGEDPNGIHRYGYGYGYDGYGYDDYGYGYGSYP